MTRDIYELISSELRQAGFIVQGNIVSLKNRDVSTLEVRMVLDKAFPEVELTVRKTDNGIKF